MRRERPGGARGRVREIRPLGRCPDERRRYDKEEPQNDHGNSHDNQDDDLFPVHFSYPFHHARRTAVVRLERADGGLPLPERAHRARGRLGGRERRAVENIA